MVVRLGSRKSKPTGGTTRLPICASAAAIVAEMTDGSAPLARFSFAAIN
jgi:hypothetical protein